MGQFPDPLPDRAPVILDLPSRLISPDWYRWLSLLRSLVGAGAQQTGSTLTLTAQAAALSITPLALPSLQNDTYRVSVYTRITSPVATSSSVTVTIGWTEHAEALSFTGPSNTGNALTSVVTFSTMIVIDQNSPITYSTAYSSTPAGMQYELIVTVEQI